MRCDVADDRGEIAVDPERERRLHEREQRAPQERAGKRNGDECSAARDRELVAFAAEPRDLESAAQCICTEHCAERTRGEQ